MHNKTSTPVTSVHFYSTVKPFMFVSVNVRVFAFLTYSRPFNFEISSTLCIPQCVKWYFYKYFAATNFRVMALAKLANISGSE